MVKHLAYVISAVEELIDEVISNTPTHREREKIEEVRRRVAKALAESAPSDIVMGR